MEKLKKTLDSYGRSLFQKVGHFMDPLFLKLKKEKGQLLVFCFHGLFESVKQKELSHVDPQNNMTVDQFVDFIDYFQSHNYQFISSDDLNRDLENDRAYAMITFDDGYFNNMLAIDVLNKFEVPGLIFISTKNIIENKSYWWDIIYKYRIQKGMSLVKIQTEQQYLKKLKYNSIEDYILKNFGKESFEPWSDIDRPFSTKEIQNLATNPYITFGNHTHNHAILSLYNEEEIMEELKVSNKIIFELTNSIPNSIAFPNGNYNQIVLAATQEMGFRYAFTTERGKNLLQIGNNKFICLNRYMTDTRKIDKWGGSYRLGYEPQILYEDLKMRTKRMLKIN